jgi:hypothetical protein
LGVRAGVCAGVRACTQQRSQMDWAGLGLLLLAIAAVRPAHVSDPPTHSLTHSNTHTHTCRWFDPDTGLRIGCVSLAERIQEELAPLYGGADYKFITGG